MFLGTLLKGILHGRIVITITFQDVMDKAEGIENVFIKQTLEDIAALIYRLPDHKFSLPVKW